MLLALVAFPLFSQKRMAITIDDLPWVQQTGSTARARAGTKDLLKTLQEAGVPAIGFVNTGKIESQADSPAWSAMLEEWIAAGFDLGNHTFSHRDLNTVGLEEYQRDVIAGEAPWLPWMRQRRPASTLYFRHPFTHTGGSKEKREAFEQFLAGRGYRVAPFTIENADYAFEFVRSSLEGKGDQATIDKLETAYLEHTAKVTGYFEKLGRSYFGRDIAQIVLMHANELNRRTIARLAAAWRAAGYEFVSLDKALADPAFRTGDRYHGKHGLSWIHRWAVAMGREMDLKNEPDPPLWMMELEKKLRADLR